MLAGHHRAGGTPNWPAADGPCQGQQNECGGGQNGQARLPPERGHQQVRVGQCDQDTDAAADAERRHRRCAVFGRRCPCDCADKRVDAGAGHAEAEEDARDEKMQFALGRVHQPEPGDGRYRAEDDHAPRAVLVRYRAGKRRRDPPDDIGDRDRHRERLTAEAEIVAEGFQIEPPSTDEHPCRRRQWWRMSG